MPARRPGGAGIRGMDLLVVDATARDPAANLALEEAVARAAPPRPVLRLWRNERCVVIGRAQRPEREANLAACAADGVPVLRRASGGGAVYQDLGNLNVTLAVPGRAQRVAADLAGLIAAALSRLGLAPTIGPRGVHIGSGKVSGLASQVTGAGSVAHATLLVATPAASVFAYLAPAPPHPRPADSQRSPVLPLRDLLPGLAIPAAAAVVLGEARRRCGRLDRRPLSDSERRWQERLLEQRYRWDSWHLTGQAKETPWTTKPALTSTG